MIIPADASAPLSTHRIQAAIDQAAAAGGGRVTLGPGLHLTGTLHHQSKWPGGQHDIRPAHSQEHGGLTDHPTNGIHISHARNVTLNHIDIAWRLPLPEHAGSLMDLQHVSKLTQLPPLNSPA